MLPTWIDPESWQAFKAMRKVIKAPLTPYAEKLIIIQLVRLKSAGEDPQACLDQSIMLSWRDVFPVRDKGITDRASSDSATREYVASMEAQAAKAVPMPEEVRRKLGALLPSNRIRRVA